MSHDKLRNVPNIVTVAASDNRPPINIDTLLDDRGQTRTMRRTLGGIVAGVLVLLAWAIIAQVDELARARGEVQPGVRVQVLQSRMGGTINKLLVKEGDTVKAGQVLIDFSTTDYDKLKVQTDTKIAALEIDRERMLAVLENRPPNLAKYENDYPLLVKEAKITYREQLASRDAAIAAKRAEGAQQGALISGAEKDKTLIERQIAEAKDRLSRLEEGARRGVVTQLALSDARQQVTSLEERLSETTVRASGMRSSVGGVGADMARVRADFNQQLSQELSKVTEQYRELLAERNAVDSRLARSDITSPIDGVVMNLPQTQEGAVIAPGGVVAEVVPLGQELIMEVMVQPRDIGFVKEGQRASVKIDSFDSARFGSVDGHVKRVAPTSTKMKENGAPFYRVEVALAQSFVGAESHRLMPGMTGEADIATGRKSVIQYLLKPIFLASDTAFHER